MEHQRHQEGNADGQDEASETSRDADGGGRPDRGRGGESAAAMPTSM
jgi:hypothetical protein